VINPTHGVDSSQFQGDTIRCVSELQKRYIVINIPVDFFETTPLISGSTQIVVEKVGVLGSFIDIEKGSGELVGNFRRAPVPREGDFTLAVIRVTAAGRNSPTDSAAQISDYVFGTDGDQLNLLTGYKTCSGGKVTFSPGIGKYLKNGVLDLNIPQYIDFINMSFIEAYVTDELERLGWDHTRFTHVLYVLPSRLERGGDAFAYAGGYLSVFYDTIIRSNIIQMHELGHNFNMAHSGEGTNAYGDGTCVMARAASYEHDNPQYCFNAAKSWWFGWYSDRHIEVNPIEDSMYGKMIGVNDYLTGQANMGDQYTLAHVVGKGEEDLYFMYNRKEGITGGVYEYADEVVIVRQSGDSVESRTAGHLSEGSQYTKANWAGSGYTLIIQVCYMATGTPDYAFVILFLAGLNDIDCGTMSPTISLAPSTRTRSPTPPPSSAPSPPPFTVPKPTNKPRICPQLVPSETIQFNGWAPTCQLRLCHGDCSKDSDCPPGLICFDRVEYSDPVPGCQGHSYLDADYCIRPTSSPTDPPTRKATPPPSNVQTKPPTAEKLCKDDPSYAHGGKPKKTCKWVAKNQKKDSLCKKNVVKKACQIVCGVCCADDPTGFKIKDKPKKCATFLKTQQKKKKCKKAFVNTPCAFSCGRCCYSDRDYTFPVNSNEKPCAFINTVAKKKKFCKGEIETKCGVECGCKDYTR